MENNVQEERFFLQMKYLRYAGISLKEESVWFNLYSYSILVSILSAGVFGIQDLMTHTDRISTLIENLVFGGSLLMAFVKISSVYIIRKKLGRAMLLLENKVFVPNIKRGGDEEEKLLNGCMVYAHAQGVLLIVLSIIYSLRPNVQTAIMRIAHSSNSSYWILPFGNVAALKSSHSPTYEMIWVYQSYANFMACISFSATNVYTAAVMAFLSGQCKILQNYVKLSARHGYPKIVAQIDGTTKEPLSGAALVEWERLRNSLKEIVKYHMLITDTTNEFEDLFCIPSLIDFLGLSVIICLSFFYVSLVPGLNYLFLQMMTFTIGTTALQFMTSYWGNELTLQYTAIGQACAEVDYTGTDIRFQKGLCLIMQRTQKPVQFTVGKFAPLTLNTFITVLRAAYSCCMLLHNVGI